MKACPYCNSTHLTDGFWLGYNHHRECRGCGKIMSDKFLKDVPDEPRKDDGGMENEWRNV